jgi:xanthine/uracil/vitamin C permease (AzgA family)
MPSYTMLYWCHYFTGSIFGLSPITSYIESGAGVEAGAKTGLTAVVCGFYFFIAIFFAPILASIPPWAIGGALIIVGALMARSLTKLNFNRVSHAVSGFLTVIVMPLTYSIAYGLIAGIGTYVVMEGVFWILSFVGLERPVDEEEASKLVIGKSFRQLTEPKDKTEAVEPKPEDPVEEALTPDNIDESDNVDEVLDEEAGK